MAADCYCYITPHGLQICEREAGESDVSRLPQHMVFLDTTGLSFGAFAHGNAQTL